MNLKTHQLSAAVFWLLIINLLLALPLPAASEEGDIYSKVPEKMPEKMTPLDCARCHYDIFMTIKNGKGAHRFPCMDCHETFHSFRRGMKYEDVLPKCTDCHDYPHGKSPDMTACKTCHQKPHAPLASLDIEQLLPFCAKCHPGPAGQLKEHPGSHSKLSCNACHSKYHGNIPKCTNCHATPHTKYVDNKGCVNCHPAHMPQDVSLPSNVPNNICAKCHPEPAEVLTASKKAHSKLHCVFCHSYKHGFIPKCQDCHGVPHPQSVIEGFKSCLACHGNPHDLELAGEK